MSTGWIAYIQGKCHSLSYGQAVEGGYAPFHTFNPNFATFGLKIVKLTLCVLFQKLFFCKIVSGLKSSSVDSNAFNKYNLRRNRDVTILIFLANIWTSLEM